MMKVRGVEALTLVVGMAATQALGSGVGVSYYAPSTPVPAHLGTPHPGAGCAPVAGCKSCQRLGFACVDHASPVPCTPEGGCHPTGPWGFSPPRWRRWPGTEEGGPAPTTADEQDSLLPAYEPPAPEDEDQQAPPSLEEEGAADNAEEEGAAPRRSGPGMNGPGRELSLPPLPQPALPTPRPGGAAPAEPSAPPTLPFGFAPPASGGDSYGPPTPPFRKTPVALPKPEMGRDAPPPLPMGFTLNGAGQPPRRLPTTLAPQESSKAHFDGSVQPASAQLSLGN